jgi:monoamine oxidase
MAVMGDLRLGEVDHATGADDAPVVIVGAGLTGLTTAWRLHQAGIRSLVIEANGRLGGRVETVTYPDGAVAEAHMEEFWEGSPAYPMLLALGLPLAEDVAHSSVVIDGRLHRYRGDGDRDEYLSGLFSRAERDALLRWTATAWEVNQRLSAARGSGTPLPARLRGLMATSFRDHIEDAGLPHRVGEWIRVTLESEIAVEWDKIATLDGIAEMRVFLDSPEGFGERNFHVVGGNTTFVRALADELPAGSILTGSRVTRVEDASSGIRVHHLDRTGAEHVTTGRYAVVTVPLWCLEAIAFDPPLSPARRRAVATTRFGSYVKVHFRVGPEAESIWAHHEGRLFTLLSDSPAGCIYNTSAFGPEAGKGHDLVITALVHGGFARSLGGLPDAETSRLVVEAMEALVVEGPGGPTQLFAGFGAHVTSSRVFSYPLAVAYWPAELGRSRFDDLAVELRRPQGRVLIGGDTTDSSHSEGAVQAANRMAEALLSCGAELGRSR